MYVLSLFRAGTNFSNMLVLFLISFLVIAVYTLLAVVCSDLNSNVPYSISETYYRLEHKKWFTVAMLLTAFTLLPPALDVSTENSQFLMFLSVVSMAVIGLAPNFILGPKSERIAHYTASALLLVFTQLWVYFNCPWFLLTWVVFFAVEGWRFSKTSKSLSLYDRLLSLKPMFWAEVVVILTVYGAVLVGLIG